VYDIKHNEGANMSRYKARLDAQGFRKVSGRDFYGRWELVPISATTGALFAVAVAKDRQAHHMDMKTAFFNANMDKEMYIKLPVEAEPGEGDDVRRLSLALYGTKEAGRMSGIKLKKELNVIAAVRSMLDSCFYTWSQPVHELVYILVYV